MNDDDVIMVPLTVDQCAVITAVLLYAADNVDPDGSFYPKVANAIDTISEAIFDYQKGIS